MKKKPRGRPRTSIDINQVRALLSEGLSWRGISKRLHVGAGTLRRTIAELGWPKPARGRPMKVLDHRKLDSITVPEMESPLQAFESLLIFDARCLDRPDRQALMSFIPQLLHIHRAWKAEYMECGCISCHKKKAGYGAGGFFERRFQPCGHNPRAKFMRHTITLQPGRSRWSIRRSK